MPQVRPEHYNSKEYNSVERFSSYAHQLRLISNLQVESILEVGPGNFLIADALKRRGYAVTTCDFDPELGADVTGDVRNLPFQDGEFDLVTACQVLEHIPLTDFDQAFGELIRVARQYVIVSFPRACSEAWIIWRMPFLRSISGRNFFEICLSIPRKFRGFPHHSQHYWEIGRSTPLRVVRSKISSAATIISESSPVMIKWHYFFVVRKIRSCDEKHT